MSIQRPPSEIIYPESDGLPMGETDLHIDWIIRLRDMLKLRYRDEKVYVGSDLLLYFEEGVPSSCVVPDCFVVMDCDPGRRRTFKIWEERRTPNVVFEITSLTSRHKDSVDKPRIYSQLAVAEYFVYDPLNEYLDPVLQGHRLTSGGEYVTLEPNDQGALTSEQLGVFLSLVETDLVLTDIATGKPVQTVGEAATASAALAREAEREAREAERIAREAHEAARTELEKLRKQIRDLGGEA